MCFPHPPPFQKPNCEKSKIVATKKGKLYSIAMFVRIPESPEDANAVFL